MTKKNKIENQIIELLSNILKIQNYSFINKKLKNIDSIEKVKLVIALESKFKVEFISSDFDKMGSIISITNIINNKK
jgi:acyl carrier protein